MRKFIKVKIFFSFFLLFCTSLYAQEFGGNPPSLKWKQVNTPQVRIIFPEGLDTQAIQIATIAKKITLEQPASLGKALEKVNIVIQNQTLQSNGHVGLGPYRSEFLLSPSPNSFELGSLPWHQTLAIHEYRHVQQFSNFNKGWSKVFSVLFGQQGQLFANSLVLPNWFWEGDAVANETQVSNQGRGRLPSFFNGYTSLFKENRNYSWLKLRNGSLRDYIPTHYNLGYIMIAYGRQKYGDKFWYNVSQYAVRYKGSWFRNPFQNAIKKYGGITYKEYRTKALHYFDSLNVQQRQLSLDMNQLITQSANHKHFQADYQYPYYIGKDSLLVLKSTYHSIPAFYIIDSTGEHRLRAIDLHLENYYTYHDGKIIYASYKPDLRWGWRDKTRIAIMDIASGKQQYIGHSGRYFSPAMDETGKHIIVVTLNNKGESILNYIDIKTHSIQAIPNTKHLFFTYPKFIDNENVISAARLANGKMAIVKVQLANGNIEYLSSITNRVIGAPIIEKNYIYFTASDQLADQQFAIHIQTGKLFKVTHDDISSYQPTVKDQKMARVAFTATGYALLQHSIDSTLYEPMDSATWANSSVNSIYPIITDKENNNKNILADIDKKLPYKVTNYRKGTDFFNFHSWRPFYSTPSYSFTIYGENVLNTFRSELSYTYNKNEKSHTIAANALYGALFPYLNVGGNYTFHRTGITDNGQIVHWNEIEANGGFTIPLNLTGGRNYTSLDISSNYAINKRNFNGIYKDSFNNNSFTYLNTSLSFTRQIQSAVQHIYPKFAQTFLFNVRNAFTTEKEFQWLASAGLYFPGLFPNHNLVLEGAYQQHNKNGNISFSNGFPFSRGYTVFNFQEMQKLGVNYHFPLLYPDFGIGGLVYFSRIRGNVFYDYTRITHSFIGPPEPLSFNFTSTGAEIYFDTKLWNEYPLTIGLRYSRLLDKNPFVDRVPNQWEIILPTNLF